MPSPYVIQFSYYSQTLPSDDASRRRAARTLLIEGRQLYLELSWLKKVYTLMCEHNEIHFLAIC